MTGFPKLSPKCLIATSWLLRRCCSSKHICSQSQCWINLFKWARLQCHILCYLNVVRIGNSTKHFFFFVCMHACMGLIFPQMVIGVKIWSHDVKYFLQLTDARLADISFLKTKAHDRKSEHAVMKVYERCCL